MLYFDAFLSKKKVYSPAAQCITKKKKDSCVSIPYRDICCIKQKETSLFLKLVTEVKQRAFGDWHIQRVPCQSCAQSISSSQSVLFVCWICFGTCRPLIDMGARAGKTLWWSEANIGLSVVLPQMFGLRAVVQQGYKIWTLFPFSLYFCSFLTALKPFQFLLP